MGGVVQFVELAKPTIMNAKEKGEEGGESKKRKEEKSKKSVYKEEEDKKRMRNSVDDLLYCRQTADGIFIPKCSHSCWR